VAANLLEHLVELIEAKRCRWTVFQVEPGPRQSV